MIVERFLTWIETAPEDRKPAAASALARAYLTSPLGEAEAQAAEAAMTVLLDEPSAEVRKSLANALCNHPAAPRHVISALAGDIAEIAMRVLARSPVFLDAELIEIAASAGLEQRIAIACRAEVSSELSAGLAEIGEEEVSLALLMNDGAQIPARALHRIAERHGENAEVRSRLMRRDGLTPDTRIELIEKLGDTLRADYEQYRQLPPARIDALVSEQCEKALIGFASNLEDDELGFAVAALIARAKVTPAFLLRAIGLGNIKLFAAALAALSRTPPRRVEAVLDANRRAAFRALYAKAGLPESAFDVFERLIATWRTHLQNPSACTDDLPHQVTREVLENYRGSKQHQGDALLVLLRRIAAETARDNSRNLARRIVDDARQRTQMLLAAPKALTPEEQWPVAEIAPETLCRFAQAFAEELVELEEELEMASAIAEPDEPVPGEAANDDVRAGNDKTVEDTDTISWPEVESRSSVVEVAPARAA